MFILSIDFGTSSMKMAILDKKLNIMESVKVEYSYKVYNQDWVELKPELLIDAMQKGVKELEKYVPEVEIVAYDALSPSIVLMNKDGDALYPVITHLDRRSKMQTKKILDEMGKDHFQKITGIQPFTGGASITSILWLKDNLPEIFDKTYKMGHLNTYLYHWLTGMWASDPVNASMMGLYETTKWGSWSEEINNAFKIPLDKLPELYNAGTILGCLNKKAAAATGLCEGIPVVLGTNDITTAQVAAGSVNEGDSLIISGSSEMISIISSKPIINDQYYLRNAITPGQWQIYATTLGGFALEWFRNEFYKDMSKDEFFNIELVDVIENHVEKATARFLPYLAGDRQSLEPKKAAFLDLTLNTTRKDLLAAILLGIHQPIINTVNLSSEFIKLNKTINLTGGMVTGPFINLKKKLFGGFDFSVKDNCTIIGNGMLALKALAAQGQ